MARLGLPRMPEVIKDTPADIHMAALNIMTGFEE
jgi:hypothetical protein